MKEPRSIETLEALDAPLADLGDMAAQRHHEATLWSVKQRRLRKFFIPHH